MLSLDGKKNTKNIKKIKQSRKHMKDPWFPVPSRYLRGSACQADPGNCRAGGVGTGGVGWS